MPKPHRTPLRPISSFAVALATLPGAGAHAQPAVDPAQWPGLPGHVLIRPAIEHAIRKLLRQMTLEEKIGQMVQADIGSIQPSDLARYKLGAVLAGGSAAPGNDVHASPAAWRAMVAAYKHAAVAKHARGHAGIPLLFGIDAVHGDAKIPGATIFPHNIGLGAAHDPALVERIGAATAQEVKATGVDWAFAPTLAVARDVRWGRSYESYADDPALVSSYAGSMVTGLQGQRGTAAFLDAGHVLSTAKHFLGDGGTTDGRDQGNDTASQAILRDVHAPAYRAALQAGVTTVMASYSSWQGIKMHANAALLTGVLKQRWGFDGFVIGDWNAQEEIPGCTRTSCARMVNAGVDMVMAPDDWRDVLASLLAQARSGELPRARIDDAVLRILRVKALAGLIGPTAPRGTPPGLDVIGNAAHRALARRAVRESLVLLKNDRALLPLAPRQNVLVVGEGADAIGQQCGGWTLDWQGANNRNADIPGATSIFAGIRQAVVAAGGTATLSVDGRVPARPDVAIVVFGEQPYAEFQGDRETLMLPRDAQDRQVLQRLHDAGIPVVSVLLSGRPLWINPELNRSDAFVAAWLPGSEGEGVADMLFRPRQGAAQPFTGRLSFPWPATALPVAYAADGTPGPALFDRGYGLAGAQPSHLAQLSEDPRIPPDLATRDGFFAAGHVVAPWSIYAADPAAALRMTLPTADSPTGALHIALDGQGLALRWSGHAPATLRIGGRPTNLAAAAGRGVAFSYRIDQPPVRGVQWGLLCGEHCGAWIDVTRLLAPGGWHQLTVPLACFAQHGADLRDVETPFALRTDGPAAITLRSVALSPAAVPPACP